MPRGTRFGFFPLGFRIKIIKLKEKKKEKRRKKKEKKGGPIPDTRHVCNI